ncbi:MAG: hypothetical protein WBA97_21930 [Actinophytocola sp.]
MPVGSWPSADWVTTRAQSIVPSSWSVTVSEYGTVSPKSNMPPCTGPVNRTVGSVLPEVTATLATPVLPVGSVTVSWALNWPLAV